jgi:exodeoxyribonuclease VII small subunit
MQEQTPAGQDGTEPFEVVYHGLEGAVERLETGGLSLEDSIELYELGMRLARRCKAMLDAAELRVTQLEEEIADGMGNEPEVTFDPAERGAW